MFGDAGKLDLLRTCVGANVVFFRAPDVMRWNRTPQPIRRELEQFSHHEFLELAACIEPKAILALGLKTFDMLDGGEGDNVCNETGKTLIRLGRCAETPLIGLSLNRALNNDDVLDGLITGLRWLD
jgi:hypothetical protein